MFVKRVKVTDWRGIGAFEAELAPGLNVICGDNERGKSSLADAIQKALYWNSSSRKSGPDRLDSIVPVGRPTARPTVELELELSKWLVRIKKVASPQAKHRSCELHVTPRAGGQTESLAGEAAEKRLQVLLESTRSAGSLLFSGQGVGYSYLSEELPAAAIQSLQELSISHDGGLSASRRLEQVRRQLEKLRNDQLVQRLASPLVEAAKSHTDAARDRENLRQTQQALQEAKTQWQAAESLQTTIAALKTESASLQLQATAAAHSLNVLLDRQRTQDAADRAAAAAQGARGDANSKLTALEQSTAEIQSLQQASPGLKAELDRLTESLERQNQANRSIQEELQQARARRNSASGGLEQLKKQLEAVEASRDARRAAEDCERIGRVAESLERLTDELNAAKARLQRLGGWPTDEQIGGWRQQYQELSAVQQEAQSKLQIDLCLEQAATIEWVRDGDPQPTAPLAAGQTASLQGVRSLRLTIPNVGRIDVRCGAEELVKLVDQIGQRTEQLNRQLAPFQVTVANLPAGFDRLESLRMAGQEAKQGVTESHKLLQAAEKQQGGLAHVRQQAAAVNHARQDAVARLDPLRLQLPVDLDDAGLAAERLRLAELIKEQELAVQSASHRMEGANTAIVECSQALGRLRAELEQARNNERTNRNRLTALLCDGRSEEERASEINGQRLAAARAEEACQQALAARDALGPAVSQQELTGQADNAEDLQQRLRSTRELLAHKRGELSRSCQDDPPGRIEQLTIEAAGLERRLADQEHRLAGIVLLDALLTAERRRLARLVVRPLNERIGPWLQELRGEPGSVVLDEGEGKISKVVWERDGQSWELPFAEFSEGFKEQLGLLLRLTLARLAASPQERPFILLDDPLTETSPGRRPAMFRILSQAAQDAQILLLTCHHDILATLPSQLRRIEI